MEMQIAQAIHAARADSIQNYHQSQVTDYANDGELKRLFITIAKDVCPGYKVIAEQKQAIQDVFNWCIMRSGKYDPHKGLWIHGDIGSGKSTLLEIVRRFCGEVRPPISGDRYSFRTINAIEVCSRFSRLGYQGIEEFIHLKRQAFDELGSECVPTGYYGTTENVFQYILQRRYDNRFNNFTHVTTNFTLDDVRERYGERIYDRCKEMFNFVELNGKTFRNNN